MAAPASSALLEIPRQRKAWVVVQIDVGHLS
jgi:hypothetical protein